MGFNVEEEYKLLIGGEWVSTSDHYDIIDPNTTEVVGHAPEASKQQANDAAAAAKMALRSWTATAMAERCALLAKAADLLEARLPPWPAWCRRRRARRSTWLRRCSCRYRSNGCVTISGPGTSTSP